MKKEEGSARWQFLVFNRRLFVEVSKYFFFRLEQTNY
jgi:hypothetical protein